MTVFIYISCKVAMGGKPTLAVGAGLLPAGMILALACLRWPQYLLAFTFIVNYIILGLGRYVSIPVPTTIILEMLFALLLLCFLLKTVSEHNFRLEDSFNAYWVITFVWMLWCILNIANGITGSVRPSEWYRAVRPIGFYPLLISLIVGLYAMHYSFIRKFLVLWGLLILCAAVKGYCQRNYGFDHAEFMWLMSGGARTHLISTGVRYFSFFSDAANYGCGMGMSLVVYFVTSLYTRNRLLRVFYFIVAMAGGYGMLISGTRSALAVPIVGAAMYTVLCKNVRVCVSSGLILAAAVFILACTNIGDNNRYVHRMRTAFDKDDASMNVRYENQKAIKSYMAETPFGIGLGLDYVNLSSRNKYYLVASTPPDSDLVNIWIRLGQVGLTVYLLLQGLVLAIGSCNVWFRVRNPEIRGPLTGMICGCGGLLVASYANMVYFQFPNGPCVYTCLTLVCLAPFFDRQYSEEHGIQAA
jgi:hypothetical protein